MSKPDEREALSITCIGPFETAEGPAHLALALGATHGMVSAPGASREAALDALSRMLPRGAGVRCDPDLAEAARARGWIAAPLEPRVNEFAALAAIALVHGSLLRKVPDLDLQEQLATAAVAFARARPWERFEADVGMTVTLTGALTQTREAVIFGQQGEEFGLSLYGSRAQLETFLTVAHVPDQARRIDTLTCLTGLEGGRLADAVRKAWGTPMVPHYLLMEGGRTQPLRADDARVLVASLRAFTAIARTGAVGEGRCEALGKTVVATVRSDAKPIAAIDDAAPQVAPHAFHALDAQYLARAVAFARARGLTAEDLAGRLDEGAGRLRLWLAMCAEQPGGPSLRHFVAAEPEATRAELARWAEPQLRGRLALLVVLSTRPGVLVARDLFLDRTCHILDVGLARTAIRGTAVLGWVIEIDGQFLLASNRDEVIPLDQAFLAADQVVGRFGPLDEASLARREVCEVAVTATKPQPPPPARPRNTDGELIAFATDRYRLAHADAVSEGLATEPRVKQSGEGSFDVSRVGNARHRTWRRTTVASLRIDGSTLEVEANSHQRLDATRAWLEQRFGDGLAFVERRTRDDLELPNLNVELDAQPMADGPWIAVVPMLEQRVGLCLSDGAALEGAAADAQRAACRRVLQSSLQGGVEGLALRRALGVSLRGTRLDPDQRWLGLGAGLPLSLALQTLVAPVLDELQGDQHTSFCDALRLGWAAWEARAVRAPRSAQLAAALAALAPVGRGKRQKRDGWLEVRLPASSPNARVDAERVAWLIERAELFFPFDLRRIHEVQVTRANGGLHTQVRWVLEPSLAAELKPLGYASESRPLERYEDLELVNDFGWRVTPPAWRRELIADWLCRTEGPLDADFDTVVERRVALEDACFASLTNDVRRACLELEDLGLSHVEAVRRLLGVPLASPQTPRLLREAVSAARAQTHRSH